jgi:hypothetical protein
MKETLESKIDATIARLAKDPDGNRRRVEQLLVDLEREAAKVGRVRRFLLRRKLKDLPKIQGELRMELMLLDALRDGTLHKVKTARGPRWAVPDELVEKFFGVDLQKAVPAQDRS